MKRIFLSLAFLLALAANAAAAFNALEARVAALEAAAR